MDCVFCKIINGEIPAKIIYEDDLVLAFDDAHPKAPQHKLIIPRKHFATLNDLPKEDSHLAGHLLLTAQRLAAELGIAQEGYRVIINCNSGGGQEVYHVHVHLLGGRKLQWPPG